MPAITTAPSIATTAIAIATHTFSTTTVALVATSSVRWRTLWTKRGGVGPHVWNADLLERP